MKAGTLKISIDGRRAYSYKKGLAEFNKELDFLSEIHPKVTMNGLCEATDYLIKQMTPKTPMDTGDLRRSVYYVTSMHKVFNERPMFENEEDAARKIRDHTKAIANAKTKQKRKGVRSSIVLGYSAYYTKHVHDLSGDVKWTTPGTEAQWFKNAVIANKAEMKKIIETYTSRQIAKARAKRTKEIMDRPMVKYKETFSKNRFKGLTRNDMFKFDD